MNVTIEEKSIKKVVNIFASNSILNSIGNTIISNTYVLFLSSAKGFSDAEISLIVGVLPLISVFTFFILGTIIDRGYMYYSIKLYKS